MANAAPTCERAAPWHREVVGNMIQAHNDPDHTIYDVLQLPQYKTWNEHDRNYREIAADLDPLVCGCAEGAILSTELARIWPLIDSPLKKQTYDTNTFFSAPPPVLPIPLPTPPPRLATPHGEFKVGQTRNIEFKGVQGCPTLFWRRLPVILYAVDKNNSFWVALSIALWESRRPWTILKATTNAFYQEVMGHPQHPRHQDYINLDNYTVQQNTAGLRLNPPRPVASIAAQLAAAPTAEVSPQLWQIVADAHRIELFVIVDVGRSEGRRPFFALIPRGEHNTRQVFLRREMDGEYGPVRPNKHNLYDFHFHYHLPQATVNPAKKGAAAKKRKAETAASNTRRCPFLLTDHDGVNLTPARPIPGFNGADFASPPHVLTEASLMRWPTVTETQLDTYLNNGLWG